MRLRIALATMTLLALPLAAGAQPISGLYVGAGAGYNILQNEDRPFGNPYSFAFDGGFVGLASAGYGFGNGLRLEVEGDYRSNKLYREAGPGGGVPAGGDELKYAAMLNALYDFRVLPSVTPYLGGGVG